MNYKVIQGDNIDTLKQYPDNYFDSIVTDPPYGIEFLAKQWDKNTGAVETWAECLRVLKPGGYLLAFSAARTYHNLATNVEGVGFEIRDQLMWLYASGFPKAQDMGKAIQKRQGVKETIEKEMIMQGGFDNWVDTQEDKNAKRNNQTINETVCTSPEAQQWAGWKTALKPAHEPIVMARKPYKGSCIDNVLTHGTGALNIDATRVDTEDKIQSHNNSNNGSPTFTNSAYTPAETELTHSKQGRYPSNVLGEVTDYQKFFYCPKVNRAERHIGFEAPEPEPFNNPDEMKKHPLWDPSIGTNSHRLMTKIREHQKGGVAPNKDSMLEEMGGHWVDPVNGDSNMCVIPHIGKIYVHGIRDEYIKWCKANNKPTQNMGNNHPTVKPVALMKYLVKLVTPPGGKVLDPFCGSGSTGMAAVELDYDFTGCELDPDYVAIADARITAWKNKTDLDNNPLPEEWFTE